jgi:O-antigen/teichoic acid export membrane protein
MIVAMGTNFLISIVTTRNLSVSAYGNFKLVSTLWTLLTYVSTLGYFQSAGRVLLLEHDPKNTQGIMGVTFSLAILMGAAVMGITVLGANLIDLIFRSQVATILITMAPFVMVLTVRDALTFILPSTNKVMLLAILTSMPSVLYLACLIVVSQLTTLTVQIVLFSQQISLLLVCLWIVVQLKPRLHSFKTWLAQIAQENRTFGWPVYIGSLVGVAVTYLNTLTVAFWVDTAALGLYSLSLNIVEPIKMIPSAVGTASVRDFAHQNQISRRVVWTTWAVSSVFLVVCMFLFGKPLGLVYSGEYESVGQMARVASFGAMFYGLGNFYNRFLIARGQGKTLRRISYVAGGINVVALFVFVPLWNVWGAILSTILVGGTYFILTLLSYHLLIRQGRDCDEVKP